MEALTQAGLRAGEQVALALDCASSEFFDKKSGTYRLKGEGKEYDGKGLVEWYASLCAKYPIVSIEDGCDENDWATWKLLTQKLGGGTRLAGDDVFATNVPRRGNGTASCLATSRRV